MKIPLVDLERQHQEVANDVDAGIREVISSKAFVHGPTVAAFESEFAEFCGVRHCIGVGNGTDAIELAIRALGLGTGDRVIVPANSFIASALGVLRAGAEVVLVDCDPHTYLLDIDRLEAHLGPDLAAVVPVHLYGQVAPVEDLNSILGGIPILEDAAQAQGASRHGNMAGSLGTIAATSFYPGKNLGAYGDAGAVLTDDRELAESVRRLGNWGSNQKYHHPVVGFNSRLDSIQAVVLRAKLARLREWNRQRARAAETYNQLLTEVDSVGLPMVLKGNEHVWHLYVVRVPDRDRVLTDLQSAGVGAGVHYPTPMHLQGALASLDHARGDFPVAERLASEVLSLPMFPRITESEQEYVVDRLKASLMVMSRG